MPLKPGKANIGTNIKEMEAHGHPRDQSIAAALNVARKHRADGGVTAARAREIAHDVLKKHVNYPAPKGHKGLGERLKRDTGGLNQLTVPHLRPKKIRMPHAEKYLKEHHHVGPIHSTVAGRTDHLPMHVPSGSYVIPADIVSGMGEGNTLAGFKHMKRMFGGEPYSQTESPYGQTSGVYGSDASKARGGEASGVPIVAAGGEYVLHPDQVRDAGGGDLDMGHKVLDEFVKRMRKELVKTLKKLPGPKRD